MALIFMFNEWINFEVYLTSYVNIPFHFLYFNQENYYTQ